MATLLVITILIPLAAGLASAFAPGVDRDLARKIALGTAAATLGLSLILLSGFKPHEPGPQFAFQTLDGQYGLSWMGTPDIRLAFGLDGTIEGTPDTAGVGTPDIRLAFGLDGLSLWLFVLTSLLMITAVCASWGSIEERAPQYYGFLLALQTGLLGLFASLDVVLFYIFFEFTLIPLFFLIGLWGGPKRKKAAVTFFLYTLAGSLLTLLGVIALVVVHYQYSKGHILTFSIPELTRGLAVIDWPEWYKTDSWTSPQVLIFLLLLAGFAIKVPMFPFHTWLPLAHVEAPTAGSIVLAGVLLKVGTYGLMRFNLGMTPQGAEALFPLVATMAVAGVIYGALAALAQTDVKRLVAYSSVSHMGFIVLGIFAMNSTGLDGSIIQQLNHGLTTGALFACVGMVYDRYHTRELSKVGGLWNRFPLLAFFFMLAALGSAAVPGLCGFTGEFPILVGTFGYAPRAAVLAATGMVLGAAYLLWMLYKLLFGPLKEPGGSDAGHGGHPAVAPIAWYEIAGLSPIMILIVLIGVYPSPFINQNKQGVGDLVKELSAAATLPSRDLIRAAARPKPPLETAAATARPNAASLGARP